MTTTKTSIIKSWKPRSLDEGGEPGEKTRRQVYRTAADHPLSPGRGEACSAEDAAETTGLVKSPVGGDDRLQASGCPSRIPNRGISVRMLAREGDPQAREVRRRFCMHRRSSFIGIERVGMRQKNTGFLRIQIFSRLFLWRIALVEEKKRVPRALEVILLYTWFMDGRGERYLSSPPCLARDMIVQ